MNLLKSAHHITIVSVLLFMVTFVVDVVDFYIIDSTNPHVIQIDPPIYNLTALVPISWYLTFVCSAMILVSWCWNLSICIKMSKNAWWTWLNIITALIIGMYVLSEIYAFFYDYYPGRYFLLYLPHGIILQSPNIVPAIWGIYVIWLLQYGINSVYVLKCYKLMKHYHYPPKEEFSDAQRARYEAVKD